MLRSKWPGDLCGVFPQLVLMSLSGGKPKMGALLSLAQSRVGQAGRRWCPVAAKDAVAGVNRAEGPASQRLRGRDAGCGLGAAVHVSSSMHKCTCCDI